MSAQTVLFGKPITIGRDTYLRVPESIWSVMGWNRGDRIRFVGDLESGTLQAAPDGSPEVVSPRTRGRREAGEGGERFYVGEERVSKETFVRLARLVDQANGF